MIAKRTKIWVLNPPFLPKYSRPQRSPAVTKSGTLYFPMWQAYCVGLLEREGHDVTFTDAPAANVTHKQTVQMAREIMPELVVLDTSTPSIENDLQVAEAIKKAVPGCFIVLGGTHVSALAEETLRSSKSVDAVARREYEYTISELAQSLSVAHSGSELLLKEIEGLSFLEGDAVIHNADREYIKDLDDLPWVSRVYKKHLTISDYFNQNALHPMVTLVTGRGCPFRCSFCVYPQTFTGHQYRLRSVDDVVEEMAFVEREMPEAKSFFFEDDTLTANKKRCCEFAAAIVKRGIRIPWQANARADLDLDTMRKLKAAGCRELCVGFESGSQDVLDGMKKGTHRESMFTFMENARKAGLLIHGCFMIGFPGETRDIIEQTIDLAIDLKCDTAQFYPVMVYPGTTAFDEYRERNWVTAPTYRNWLTADGGHNCVVCNEHLSSDELMALCALARKRFYLRPRYIAYKLRQVAGNPSEMWRTAKAATVFFKHLLFAPGLVSSRPSQNDRDRLDQDGQVEQK